MADLEPELSDKAPLSRSLDLRACLGLVIGSVIGTGVFLKAAPMAQLMGSVTWVMVAWVFAGLLSFTGALCYSELGSRFPHTGGEYVYLKESFGKGSAFSYGWVRFWIVTPASVAAYAVGCTTFISGTLHVTATVERDILAVALILLFSGLNCFAVAIGGRIQFFLTLLKVTLIAGLGISLLTIPTHFTEWIPYPGAPQAFPGFQAFSAGLIAALWAYDGWNNLPMAAGEVKDATKNLPRALIFGMLAVIVLYTVINLAYFHVLPFPDIVDANSHAHPAAPTVAALSVQKTFGDLAARLLSLGFVISALGAMNGAILTGARIPFAMARDGLFFKRLGHVGKESRVPVVAIIAQGCVAAPLALSGSFDELTNAVVFASWIFYALITASLFKIRKKETNPIKSIFIENRTLSKTTYYTPFYPWLPLVFIVCALGLLVNTVAESPRESAAGLAFMLLGIPAFYWFKSSSLGPSAPPRPR